MSRVTSAQAWICLLGQEEAQPFQPQRYAVFCVVLFFIEKHFLFGGLFMKKDSKKLISLVLALTLMLSALGVMSAGAKTEKTVKVTVQNYRMSTEDGAPWSGELLSVNVELKEDDSMETLIERAITSNGYEFTVSNYGYISSINGLAEYAYNGSGGWMATLNDKALRLSENHGRVCVIRN